jgi:hypothetical protein
MKCRYVVLIRLFKSSGTCLNKKLLWLQMYLNARSYYIYTPNFLCIQHPITHSMPPQKRPHPAPLLCYITPPTLSPLPPPPPSASYPVSATHSHSTPVRYPMPEVWRPRQRIPLPPWRQQISTSLISASSSSPTPH